MYPIILALWPSPFLLINNVRWTLTKQKGNNRIFNYLVSKISPQIPLITQHEHPCTYHYIRREILRTFKQKLFNKRPLNLLKFVYKVTLGFFFSCAEYARNQNKVLVEWNFFLYSTEKCWARLKLYVYIYIIASID